MRHNIVKEGNLSFLICECPVNFDHGFISSTGKSFVYRVNGTYLKSNGEIAGKEGSLSGYLNYRLNNKVKVLKHTHYSQSNVFKHDFGDDIIVEAVKIPISSF